MFLAPLTLLKAISLLIGLVLFIAGLSRMRRGWKVGLPWIGAALLLQSWWVIFFLWLMTQGIEMHQEISIKAGP